MSLDYDDLMTVDVITDPHAYYRRLREYEPIHWNERWGGWVLTRYSDVVQVLRDSKNFSSDRMAFLARELSAEEQLRLKPIFDVLSRWIVFRDPPGHTKLRLLLNGLLTPKAVERYRPMVRRIVSDLLDRIESAGRAEIVREFAYEVPMTVILELMGEPDLDRDLIKEWSELLGAFFFIRADEPRRREMGCEGVTKLVDYLTPLIEKRRSKPTDDLIGVLVAAEQRGDISAQDVLATCVLLVFGGHETTMNLIANGTLALLRHPDQWERLKNHPELAPSAVEELLRYDGSVKATVRWARDDVEVAGVTIHAGHRVLVSLSGANRDPEKFERPDDLVLERDPNLHVAFAHGIHVCLGASLARMEAQEAFLGLTGRLRCPTLECKELEYHPSVVGRAIKTLPVAF